MPQDRTMKDWGLIRAKMVSEKQAVLVSCTYDKRLHTRRLLRLFPLARLDDAIAIQAIRGLDAYGSAANSKPGPFVKDPLASREPYYGEWAVTSNTLVKKQGDTPQGILQSLTQVYTVRAVRNLTDPGPDGHKKYRVTRDNEILDLFGLQTGEGDTKAFVWSNIKPTDADETYCMETLSDASLVTALGSTYTYASRRWIRPAESENVATFMVLLRLVTWQTWGHDSYAADIIDYPDNAAGASTSGEYNEKEFIRKIWVNIRNADMATARENARIGTNVAAESGYYIMSVVITDNHNGSFTLTQIQRRQVNAQAETDKTLLNPHGIFEGLGTLTITLYENFDETNLPAGTDPSLAANIVQNKKILQANGLWGRRVLTFAPTWAKTWSDKVKFDEQHTSGYGLTEHNRTGGIPNSGRAAAFTAAQTTSNANTRLVTMVRLIEAADGERIIDQDERRIWAQVGTDDQNFVASSTALGVQYISLDDGLGKRRKSCGRVWWRRSHACKETLIANAGAASSAFTPTGISTGLAFAHSAWRVNDNGDGSYDIYQTGEIITSKLDFDPIDTANESEVLYRAWEQIVRDATGAPKRYLFAEYQQIFATQAAACAYADNSDVLYQQLRDENDYELLPLGYSLGHVKYLGNTRWAGYCVELYDLTAGAQVADAGAWTVPTP